MNTYGQLGNSNNTNSNTPGTLGSTTGWKSVAAGYEFTVALKRDGTVVTFGENDYGQLGNNNAAIRTYRKGASGHRRDMAGRVVPFAERIGAETYKPGPYIWM